MKLFALQNGKSGSDFELNTNGEPFTEHGGYAGSNAHSGGIVILAENLEEAKKIMLENFYKGDLIEIEEKVGVVIQCDGDC